MCGRAHEFIEEGAGREWKCGIYRWWFRRREVWGMFVGVFGRCRWWFWWREDQDMFVSVHGRDWWWCCRRDVRSMFVDKSHKMWAGGRDFRWRSQEGWWRGVVKTNASIKTVP